MNDKWGFVFIGAVWGYAIGQVVTILLYYYGVFAR
jgi:hypothetical protein